jgi:hypothetical protein
MARNWVPSSTLELSGATMFDSIFFLGEVRDCARDTPEIVIPYSVGALGLVQSPSMVQIGYFPKPALCRERDHPIV